MAAMDRETIRLDTALYIGIGIDLFLAVIAGVLIYKWRQRKKEKKERSRQVDRLYGTSQRTELETLNMDSRSVSRIVGPGSARHSLNHVKPAYMSHNSVSRSIKDADGDGVRSSCINQAYEGTPDDPHYDPPIRDDRVIQNPIAGKAVSPNVPDSEHNNPEDMSLITYYTYKPPVKQLDGESSEIMSQGEKSPVFSPPPDEFLELHDEGSRQPPSPPSPLPVSDGNEYSYLDDTAADDKSSSKSWSTMNFGQESVAQLYTTDFEESTEIM